MPIVDAVLRNRLKTENTLLPGTLSMVTENIKSIIFAGVDTTASVISHALYELSQNPVALQQLRKEHDDVLGSDSSHLWDSILSKPSLLNELPYTLAVMKETMRMYTPIGSTRMGQKGFNINTGDARTSYPTEGCMVYLAGPALHRDPDLYPRPGEFHPERFMSDGRSEWPDLPKYAYRPFEMGPRTCLGQDLALLESKVLLVLLARRFDFQPDYKGDDSPRNSIEGYGRRAYQTMYTTAKPKEGIPMLIKLRN
ncbi:uncharacterized protein JN550_005962 [Neoarthrinium moseri]|uniref:uncharacterized protein n=1 Tax=Neoarthrinium moseri TaxID=1658444 RepID=UPI001FDAFAB0|nr:uncharacterized protein JN550_005962 [Neoarthrinium moseri]KAI1869332.1 hypothetical protein JN550_005962 [Neoarthrinium moseri]